MENDKNLVSIKTEKVSGKLTMHIPPYSHVLTVHGVIKHINQLKGVYFLKVREIVELISCQSGDAIPEMCVPKCH